MPQGLSLTAAPVLAISNSPLLPWSCAQNGDLTAE
jgi:hypothetical protein